MIETKINLWKLQIHYQPIILEKRLKWPDTLSVWQGIWISFVEFFKVKNIVNDRIEVKVTCSIHVWTSNNILCEKDLLKHQGPVVRRW